MTVSNIRRMSESSEVEVGGIAVAVTTATESTDSSVVISLVEERGGGATLEDSTLGC